MSLWTFYDFVESNSENVVRVWFDGLPSSERELVRADFDTRLDMLGGMAIVDWRPPYSVALTGNQWAGVNEIRWKVNRIQYRALYCFGPQRKEVTPLACYLKRDGLPPGAASLAQGRKALIDDNRHRQLHFS